MYNEMVVLKLVQSMTKLVTAPPEVFRDQIHQHFLMNGDAFYQRIKLWMKLSETVSEAAAGKSLAVAEAAQKSDKMNTPDFPLIPASKGFCLTLVGFLESFHKKLHEIKAIN